MESLGNSRPADHSRDLHLDVGFEGRRGKESLLLSDQEATGLHFAGADSRAETGGGRGLGDADRQKLKKEEGKGQQGSNQGVVGRGCASAVSTGNDTLGCHPDATDHGRALDFELADFHRRSREF
jgi:hypothetical protein